MQNTIFLNIGLGHTTQNHNQKLLSCMFALQISSEVFDKRFSNQRFVQIFLKILQRRPFEICRATPHGVSSTTPSFYSRKCFDHLITFYEIQQKSCAGILKKILGVVFICLALIRHIFLKTSVALCSRIFE